MIVTLTGGVGGSKLARGLYGWLGEGLTAIVNTADDVRMHGLHVSPDLDTLMYTLAGLSNEATGWGLAGDTFSAMEMLDRCGRETWFRLGDRDLGTHLARTALLAEGRSLTEVTAELGRALGVRARLLPMSNDPVATFVRTADGELPFQEYFVHRRAAGEVLGIRFAGVESAAATPEVITTLSGAEAIVLGPSNPMVSIGPILAVPGLREALRAAPGLRAAVSPIVGGKPVSGPAGRMMQGAGVEVSVHGVAQLYADFLDVLVVDRADAVEVAGLRERGLDVLVTDTLMVTLEDRLRLAKEVLDFTMGREPSARS